MDEKELTDKEILRIDEIAGIAVELFKRCSAKELDQMPRAAARRCIEAAKVFLEEIDSL